MRNRTFGTAIARKPRINLLRLEEDLSEAHLRLANATVECLDYREFVRKYDRADTFFYLDPPYYKAPYYQHNIETEAEYREMAALLGGLKGKFLLSINDVPVMRDVFGGFHVKAVTLKYTAAPGKVTQGRELLVSNYRLPKHK